MERIKVSWRVFGKASYEGNGLYEIDGKFYKLITSETTAEEVCLEDMGMTKIARLGGKRKSRVAGAMSEAGRKEYKRSYYQSHKKYFAEKQRDYYANNKEKYKKYRENSKKGDGKR